MNEIKFTSKVAIPDYRNVLYFSTFGKNKFLAGTIFTADIILFLAYILHFTGFVTLTRSTLSLAAVVFLLTIVIFATIEFQVRRFGKTDTLILNAPKEYTAGSDQITVVDPKTQSIAHYRWEDMYKGYETKTLYLLFINSQQGMIIPKRDLTDAQLNEFKALCLKKLGADFKFKNR